MRELALKSIMYDWKVVIDNTAYGRVKYNVLGQLFFKRFEVRILNNSRLSNK